jgi:hypothetical protein
MRENGLLAPHRVGRTETKPHDGTIITDKVNEMWETDMTQSITIREGRAPRPGAYDFNVLSMLRKNRNAGGIPKGEVMTHRGRKLHTIDTLAMAVRILTLTPSQPAAQSKITVNQELKEIAYSWRSLLFGRHLGTASRAR